MTTLKSFDYYDSQIADKEYYESLTPDERMELIKNWRDASYVSIAKSQQQGNVM